MHIVDRRLNPGGKSLVNRQRFLRRARVYVQKAVRDSLKDRGIRELDKEGEISIGRDAIYEPTFHRAATGGNRERVLPGNHDYVEGDRIKRPEGGEGAGADAGQGEGNDDFQFVLSREEFLDLFLDDLELPDLAKRRLVGGEIDGIRRAGYSTAGSPSNLSVPRTMQKAMGRRMALRRPSGAELERIEEEIAAIEARDPPRPEDAGLLERLREDRAHIIRRRNLIAYIDPVDLRYRRFEAVPRPVAQAVMFCLMDVSGSMSEHMKDLAKRFFALLHLFLSRCYEHVEVVFIHHTDRAAEVDEQTFFYSTVTGGTLVSSALDKLIEVAADRYRPDNWNIYVAQASDGDNMMQDNPRVVSLMQDHILPMAQYVAYLEVGREEFPDATMMQSMTTLWQAYVPVAEAHRHFVMRKVAHRREIYPVFRELFQRRGVGERARS
ncbi:YeaH/YhbH family protein [Sphingobium baderi]|uniref:YeaH/YhbH family protein n=1 Tax=Sphingobium baderi TaxID=1332080 RepID=UPI002B406C52|nr:YeaH/YhbH family protein [Sphingobium baderi]WRD76865.1 YeaH/YhbH family protein [Sphingobium baderi]